MANLHSYDSNVSFHGIDEHAKKIKQVKCMDDVLKYLAEGVGAKQPDRELYLARGFLVWLSLAIEDRSKFSFVEDKIPAELFVIFCRCADIECVIVAGKGKASEYKVGDDSITGTHNWNAFKVNNKWHLFYPLWCVTSLLNHSHGGEIALERDGQKSMQNVEHKTGIEIACFEEIWFCTDPVIFHTSHLPDDPSWQLCKKSQSPLSLEQWLNLPYYKIDFFQLNLHLLSEESCRLKSKRGKTTIQISADQSTAKNLKFSYTLFLSQEDSTGLNSSDWPLLVLPGRHNNIFMFEIRFHVTGKYRIELIFGSSESLSQCCEFSIVCEEADPHCRKLPIQTGIEGFGYGPSAEDAGIYRPSVSGPKIYMKPENEETEDNQLIEGRQKIDFKVDEDAMTEFEYGSFLCDKEEQHFIQPNLDEAKHKLEIIPSLKTNEPEYALLVATRPKNSDEDFKPVLYYIISTEEDDEFEAQMRLAETKRKSITFEKKREEKTERNRQLQIKLKGLQETIDHLKIGVNDKVVNEEVAKDSFSKGSDEYQ